MAEYKPTTRRFDIEEPKPQVKAKELSLKKKWTSLLLILEK